MNNTGEPEDQIQDETIVFIASGYEWNCPHCHSLNFTVEITPIVQCEGCHYLYRSGEAQHAHK